MRTKLSRDPLTHFVLIGTLMFALSMAFNNDDARSPVKIVIGESRINHLSSVFERSWQRPPQREELQALIKDYIQEEVLYREAVRLGLDKDDTIIRRRLRMKMEFLAKDLVNAIAPQESALRDYYQQNISSYTAPAQFSFEQIYFDTSNVMRETAEDARIVMAKITQGADPKKLGDSNLLQHSYTGISADRADRLFGITFATQLAELPINQWAGPVTSAYGEHLVRVTDHTQAHREAFSSVRDKVLRDWQISEQKKILQTQFDVLRKNYEVEIVDLPSADEVAAQ